MKKTKKYSLDNRVKGTVRAKIEVLVDCPECHTQMKVTEQVKDSGVSKGHVWVLNRV